MNPSVTRGCLRCRQRLPVDWFYLRPSKHPAFVCKNCIGIPRMLQSAKARARLNGHQFNLKESDISVPKECPILGIPIGFHLPGVDTSPSLDRIHNHLGYTKDNVQVISTRANTLKGDSTLHELILLGSWAVDAALKAAKG